MSEMSAPESALPGPVTVRAPGKVNLSLRVGPPRADGFHPLVTVFQALDLGEHVTAAPAPRGSTTVRLAQHVDGVPLGASNLAARAAEALRAATGVDAGVELTIHKNVPAASGMAGGSADAAAALMACDALWGTALGAFDLHALAANLGSDVSFPLLGGTALGTGRGERLVVLPDTGAWHWVLATQATGLSTPAVFNAYDALHGYPRGGPPSAPSMLHEPAAPDAHTHSDDAEAGGLHPGAHEAALGDALVEGDPAALGRLLLNDLTEPALELRPELGDVLAAFERAGALGAVLSGSGPTVAALALDAAHAESIAAVVRAAEVADRVLTTTAPARGAHVVDAAPGPAAPGAATHPGGAA
ncbi:4-(cytidine 5'-diphospho)-2-C-methyl-D-erythritol kinase [Georgenia sp. Z1344]|uniref:4-(cytidine 5'-diphospho)-2-C-methyl-D-erythritol kinase n=1 Tax=Georgenia sp. Z1344 TaxID=3416706 RepID=UPI003CF6B145